MYLVSMSSCYHLISKFLCFVKLQDAQYHLSSDDYMTGLDTMKKIDEQFFIKIKFKIVLQDF